MDYVDLQKPTYASWCTLANCFPLCSIVSMVLEEKYPSWSIICLARKASQIILSKAKEAWDIFGNFGSKLKYESLVGWSRPHHSFVKVNVKVARGVVQAYQQLVESSEILLVNGCVDLLGVSPILVAELWGIYHGLLLCWNKGFHWVEIETDSPVAILKIKSHDGSYDPHRHLVVAIRELLAHEWLCSIKHAYREANRWAD